MGRVKVHNTDGGRRVEGFEGVETNDCTVRALANSTGLSYTAAHHIARKIGRRNRHGLKPEQVRTMLHSLENYDVVELPVPQPTIIPGTRFLGRSLRRTQRLGGITVNEFLWRLPKQGAYYLCCTTHAFAVVDGVLLDPREMSRSKMILAFKVEAKAGVVAPTAPTTETIVPNWQVDTRANMDRMAREKEMEAMKKRIAELEAKIARQKEMDQMKKRIAELEKRQALSAAAGR